MSDKDYRADPKLPPAPLGVALILAIITLIVATCTS